MIAVSPRVSASSCQNKHLTCFSISPWLEC
uniref:Uncharacterized protein n=1 Tax=Anguilla anguilla TaxID=7936 RepID=A0A0E9VVZ0_ANGAN